ncbi:hypothetical protein ACRAWG_12180 [Methylobacterium sp. P31]
MLDIDRPIAVGAVAAVTDAASGFFNAAVTARRRFVAGGLCVRHVAHAARVAAGARAD